MHQTRQQHHLFGFAFDKAQSMLLDEPDDGVSYFGLLRGALREVSRNVRRCIFVILDTKSDITNFPQRSRKYMRLIVPTLTARAYFIPTYDY